MESRKKVLLVGWDAADWKVIHPLMDAGKMPNVQRLVENGAMAPANGRSSTESTGFRNRLRTDAESSP